MLGSRVGAAEGVGGAEEAVPEGDVGGICRPHPHAAALMMNKLPHHASRATMRGHRGPTVARVATTTIATQDASRKK